MSVVEDLSFREIDYLIAVFSHSKGKGYTRQLEILEELNVTKSTASLMIKKLVNKGYMRLDGRKIMLAEKGRTAVKEILWRHGVIESALTKLGLSSIQACEVTWKIAQKIPRNIVESIWRKLGRPDCCPCGYRFPHVNQEVDPENFEVCYTFKNASISKRP